MSTLYNKCSFIIYLGSLDVSVLCNICLTGNLWYFLVTNFGIVQNWVVKYHTYFLEAFIDASMVIR